MILWQMRENTPKDMEQVSTKWLRDHLNTRSENVLRKEHSEIAIAYFQSIVPTLPKDAKISRDEMEQR